MFLVISTALLILFTVLSFVIKSEAVYFAIVSGFFMVMVCFIAGAFARKKIPGGIVIGISTAACFALCYAAHAAG